MTATPSLPSLVLRGSDAVARFEEGSGHVQWEQDRRVSRIPLEAIHEVRSAGRAVEVVLTTASDGKVPVVYALRDVSAAAGAAFRAAVHARLAERDPAQPWVDGEGLVTVVSMRSPRKRRGLLIAVAFLATIDVTVWVLGASDSGPALPFFQLFAVAGGFMASVMGVGLYDAWRLPRHGITVLAEIDHYTNNTKVYRYTDLDGVTHFYRSSTGGEPLELSYDPRRPSRAISREQQHPYQRSMMALMAVVGTAMAGGGLGFTCYQLVLAVRG